MDAELTTKVLAIMASVKHVDAATMPADASFDELGIDSINIPFELENLG